MGEAYHRMCTLGHDPILGWLFDPMNILTDTITLNNFKTYRVTRAPMKLTKEIAPMIGLFQESYNYIKDDFLNLPTAIFAQAQHLKSDKYTKIGLPVPVLSSFNEEFASKLYRNNYDVLCFSRDLKIIEIPFAVSKIIDMVISLTHGLFQKSDEADDIFEVRTRKILLVSNAIASSSTIINSVVTSNIKKLDMGNLLNTIAHLFIDFKFITKLKQEFIRMEMGKIQKVLLETDKLYNKI